MASRNFIVVLAAIAVFVSLPAATMAAQYWVGDKAGWTINYDYQTWASDKVFHVGDALVFNYTKNSHNVYKANQTEFQNCIVPPKNQGFFSGHDVITLATPGKKWYICGVPTHCSDFKQKLVVTVVEGGAPAPAPMWTPAPEPGTSSAYGILKSKYQVFFAAAVTVFAVVLIA